MLSVSGTSAPAGLRLVLAMALMALPAPGYAQQHIAGAATVIDGDSLTVAGVAVRLFGIDAPEGKQTCERDGTRWACGEEAARQLRSMTADNRVECAGRETDQYGRLLATCSADGFDLNRTMVAAGWATAYRKYSEDYVGEEVSAKAARLGIWDSTFDLPEAWRLAQQPAMRAAIAGRAPRTVPASSGCVIKGNRNRKGQWIYHVPGMPYYEATRAEEIFCSEAQARAAGYRRAIVR